MTAGRGPRQASGLRRAAFPIAWRSVERLRLERVVARYVIPRLRLAEPSTKVFLEARSRLEREAERLAASSAPVIVGPYLSEVGLELLYWIPFLRRLVRRYGIDPRRLVVVSRGGVASWYDGIASSYADVFELMDEVEFRASLQQSWAEQDGQKQFAVGAFDRSIADAVSQRLGLQGVELLHPSLMFNLFSEYWLYRIGLASVLEHLDVSGLAAPADPALIDRLPEDYVAARFYFRETFPDTPENRDLVARMLAAVAVDSPVVLLDTDLVVDDHTNVPLPSGVTVLRPLAGRPAVDNLHAQSVVLSRARAFVGTYGGLCYLANAFGVSSFGLITPPARKLGHSHTPVAWRLCESTGSSISIIPTTALEALRGVPA